jgi:GntR family transcriptional regulator, arabinose operon transcriptional repressor
MPTRYDKIREYVVKGIASGDYAVGDVLPAAEVLASRLRCSTGTVRNVLTDLAQQGLVKRVQRRGTVVTRQPNKGRVCLFLAGDAHCNLLLQDIVFSTLLKHGYWVDLVPVSMGADAAIAHCNQLLCDVEQADGLVLICPGHSTPPILEAFSRRFTHKVVIQLDLHTPSPDQHHVVMNHMKSAKDVAEHLLKFGHRKVALFGGLMPGEDSCLTQAANHCKDFFEVAGGEAVLHFMSDGNARLLQRFKEDAVTAFWAINDFEAMQVLNLCHRAKLRVPDDVSLIGRNDTPWSTQCRPQLTSVSISPLAMAQAVVDAMAPANGNGRSHEKVTRIDPILMVRESTGQAKHVV